MIQLLTYCYHLRNAATPPLDYSAVQIIVQLILDILRQHSHLFADVESHAQALDGIVSPKSGLGLTNLWSSLLNIEIPDNRVIQVQRLQAVGSRLVNSQDKIGIFSARLYLLELTVFQNVPLDSLKSWQCGRCQKLYPPLRSKISAI